MAETLCFIPLIASICDSSHPPSINCRSCNEHRPLKKERSLWLWDNATSERFPEVKELKQLVRDRVTPQKDLGHSEDTKTTTRITTTATKVESTANVDKVGECIPCNEDVALSNAKEETKDDDNDDDFFDDDEAEEARRYFGVL